MKPWRLLRITTVPLSLVTLLKGQPQYFQKNNFKVLTVSAAGKEAMQLTEAGIRHKSVWFTRSVSPLHDVVAMLQLVIIIIRFKPDIVHTHTPKAGLLGMLAAWICRVPVRLHTVAGLPVMEAGRLMRSVLMFTERTTMACAHKIYPNSKGLMHFILSTFKGQDSKLKMIGRGSSNGIDVDYFKRDDVLISRGAVIRQQYEIQPNEIVFSFVGRVVRHKGIAELVEAFEQVCQTIPSWLLLVGDLEEDLDPLPTATLRSIKENPRIIAPGFQQDVRLWLLASDIFVFPSYREGFPNVVMQAACLEIPVIATNINGCNEILEDGQTGVLVPPKNKDALVEAMKFLAIDQEKRVRYGRKSREFVASNFSQPYMWNELLKEYNLLLDKKDL